MELEKTGDITNIHTSPEEQMEVDEKINVSPQIVDDGLPANPRPQQNRWAPRRLSFNINQADRDWNDPAHVRQDIELVKACASESTVNLNAEGADASIFEPAPANLRAVLQIRESNIREAWLKAYRKELETIIDSGTFKPEIPLDGETCTPIMDVNAIKLKSDGALDKLKNRLVVRGDLQKNVEEDTVNSLLVPRLRPCLGER